MAIIERFLGQRVEVPEDRRYAIAQGLWGQQVDQCIVMGLSQPALVLLGGVKDIDWLVADDQTVQTGTSVMFAITGKILYLDAPVGGRVQFNGLLKQDPSPVVSDPYGAGWLFRIEPAGDIQQAYQELVDAEAYIQSLHRTEGFKNPEGLKGGVSGMCKAVYSGIGQQKMKTSGK